jgi:hypothetical protein
MANETTITTLTEAIPVIKEVAMLELDDGDIIAPLVRNVQITGPGVQHDTPFIQRLVAESDDSLANQALDSGSSDETSPSTATVGVHGITVLLKELAVLATPGDLYQIAGALMGQAIAKRRDQDLAALFTSVTAIQGGANNDIAPSDFYAAYKKLRQNQAPLPYSMVVTPGQFWGTVGIAALTETVNNKIVSGFIGAVREDIARMGFTGQLLGFNMYIDDNITVTSNNASGCAFSRDAFKLVKIAGRDFRIDVDLASSGTEVGDQVTATDIWGEAVLRNRHAVEMQFNEDT